MPPYRQRKDKKLGELLRPSHESDRILDLLRIQASQFHHELEEDELKRWLRDLSKFQLKAIDFAFEQWRMNGRFFPMPADIMQLCSAWAPEEKKYIEGCNAECRARHGKGYGTADVQWLLRRYYAMKDQLPNRRMTAGEINNLLDELDKKRGAAPEWRQ
jgi:hypothetical protein